MLNIACVLVVMLAVAFTSMNTLRGRDIARANIALTYKSSVLSDELKALSDSFQYQGPSPQKMQELVALSERISADSALPEPVFSVISDGFSTFNDLLLTQIEWHSLTSKGLIRSRNENGVNAGTNATKTHSLVVVTLVGEVADFDGDFRHSIERIELLVARLRDVGNVVQVETTRLPLDIDPSLKVSRALNDQRMAFFSIDVTLSLAGL